MPAEAHLAIAGIAASAYPYLDRNDWIRPRGKPTPEPWTTAKERCPSGRGWRTRRLDQQRGAPCAGPDPLARSAPRGTRWSVYLKSAPGSDPVIAPGTARNLRHRKRRPSDDELKSPDSKADESPSPRVQVRQVRTRLDLATAEPPHVLRRGHSLPPTIANRRRAPRYDESPLALRDRQHRARPDEWCGVEWSGSPSGGMWALRGRRGRIDGRFNRTCKPPTRLSSVTPLR